MNWTGICAEMNELEENVTERLDNLVPRLDTIQRIPMYIEARGLLGDRSCRF